MNIEELVKKHIRRNGWSFSHDGECAAAIRAALTEQAKVHAIELRAYEATVQNVESRARQLEAALEGLVSIAHDSKGVAGYHLNGDVADWYSLPEYEAALIALADAQQPKKEPRHE